MIEKYTRRNRLEQKLQEENEIISTIVTNKSNRKILLRNEIGNQDTTKREKYMEHRYDMINIYEYGNKDICISQMKFNLDT